MANDLQFQESPRNLYPFPVATERMNMALEYTRLTQGQNHLVFLEKFTLMSQSEVLGPLTLRSAEVERALRYTTIKAVCYYRRCLGFDRDENGDPLPDIDLILGVKFRSQTAFNRSAEAMGHVIRRDGPGYKYPTLHLKIPELLSGGLQEDPGYEAILRQLDGVKTLDDTFRLWQDYRYRMGAMHMQGLRFGMMQGWVGPR